MKKIVYKYFVTFSLALIMVTGLFGVNTKVYAASGDTVVYITKTGKCYHADGCSSLSKSKIETTLQSATDKGLRACSKCNPGTLDSGNTTSTANANASVDNGKKTETSYVLNTNTKKFHKTSCHDVEKIKAENYATSTAGRDDIISQGYSPCGHCNP